MDIYSYALPGMMTAKDPGRALLPDFPPHSICCQHKAFCNAEKDGSCDKKVIIQEEEMLERFRASAENTYSQFRK